MKKSITLLSIFAISIFMSCKNDDGAVLTFDEQLAIDIEKIDEYLDNNNITAEEDESGIRFVVERTGDGESPTASQSVIVKYKGSLLNGNQFDANELGINFDLSTLIESWRIMVPQMKEGGKITFYAPSGYCYGRIGSSSQGIPPNATLIFEVELVSLVRSSQEQRLIDLEKIDQHLENNNIDVEIHNSGIRYRFLETGTGISPTLTDQVTVTYTGQFLEGEIFDDGDDVELRLNTLIDAWKTMLPTMIEGDRIVIYAPSGLCYGNTGNGLNIPPNANLIFDIKLHDVGK